MPPEQVNIKIAAEVKNYDETKHFDDRELLVFDRWGSILFRTSETKQGWEGRNSPPEVYSYKATVVDHGGHAQEYFGSVTLVR